MLPQQKKIETNETNLIEWIETYLGLRWQLIVIDVIYIRYAGNVKHCDMPFGQHFSD